VQWDKVILKTPIQINGPEGLWFWNNCTVLNVEGLQLWQIKN